MHRSLLIAAALATTVATPAWADHWEEEAEDAGLVAIAPGIYAVPSNGPPMWYAAPSYYSCSGGVWSASQGGNAPWQTVAVTSLPQDLACAVDAAGHAQYGLCPGDPLPPPAAAYLGGPTVVISAGLPRIVRFGRYWHGWAPRYGFRPVFVPPPFAHAYRSPAAHCAPPPVQAYHYAPAYAPAAAPSYGQSVTVYGSAAPGYGRQHGSYGPPAASYVPAHNMAPAPGNWGRGHGGQWGGQPAWNGGGHGGARGGRR